MAFYDELVQATAAERNALLSIPIIGAALAGRVSLAQYLAFLIQAYHHVKHTLPLLMACGGRIPESHEWLRTSLTHYIEEETGHQEWILNDIRACGGDAEAVRHGKPNMHTELMVAYAYDVIARQNPVGFLGMVHVLEGASVQLAIHAATAIQKSLNLPKAAFSYLNSHGSLDIEHVGYFKELVNMLSDEQDRQAVLHCARMFYYLYGNIFRSLPQGEAL